MRIHGTRLLVAALASVSAALCFAADATAPAKVPAPLPASVFQARRERLMKQLGPGVAVLYSKGEEDRDGFKSHPSFYYLTGVDEEGAILVLAPGERVYREALFLESVDPEAERWVGLRGMIGDSLRGALGFPIVGRTDAMNAMVMRALSHHPVLHMIAGPVSPNAPVPPESELYSKLQARVPGFRSRTRRARSPRCAR